MKSVCLCGSLKFYREINELCDRLKLEGIPYRLPNPSYLRDQEDPSKFVKNFDKISDEEKIIEARRRTLEHFRNIDETDITFIYNKNGYVGESTFVELIHAYDVKKPIYTLEKETKLHGETSFVALGFVSGVMQIEELIRFLKED